MLCLTLRLGESIVIAGNIVVTVVDAGTRGKCRLGVDAPRDIPVNRSEVHERKVAAGLLPPLKETP